VRSTVIVGVTIMTRYETAVAALSMWLTKARTPSDPRPLSLHPDLQRRDASSQKPPLLARLWRTVGARDRHIAGHPEIGFSSPTYNDFGLCFLAVTQMRRVQNAGAALDCSPARQIPS